MKRKMIDRILWNRRPAGPRDCGDIDEIVLFEVDCVHVEQMDDRCWWIGLTRGQSRWMGEFRADSRGRMTFYETENDGIAWHRDDEHEVLS